MPCRFFDVFCAQDFCFSKFSSFSVFAAIILQFNQVFLLSLVAVKPRKATWAVVDVLAGIAHAHYGWGELLAVENNLECEALAGGRNLVPVVA